MYEREREREKERKKAEKINKFPRKHSVYVNGRNLIHIRESNDAKGPISQASEMQFNPHVCLLDADGCVPRLDHSTRGRAALARSRVSVARARTVTDSQNQDAHRIVKEKADGDRLSGGDGKCSVVVVGIPSVVCD